MYKIDGFPDYLVSDRLLVWSKRKHKYLKPNNNGQVFLYNNSGYKAVTKCWLEKFVNKYDFSTAVSLPDSNRYLINKKLEIWDKKFQRWAKTYPDGSFSYATTGKKTKHITRLQLHRLVYGNAPPGFVKIKQSDGYFANKDGDIFSTHSGRCLKAYIDKKGYCVVGIKENGVKKQKRVHRLVAETFIPNTLNLEQVNHKDGDKTNNNVDNLEWCDDKYNVNHALHNGLIKKCIPILAYKHGSFLKEYPSLSSCSKAVKVSKSKIKKMIDSESQIPYLGYTFHYKDYKKE